MWNMENIRDNKKMDDGAGVRVTKSKNFPDSKIFVAKTFRIKRVNRDNFQIRDKCV